MSRLYISQKSIYLSSKLESKFHIFFLINSIGIHKNYVYNSGMQSIQNKQVLDMSFGYGFAFAPNSHKQFGIWQRLLNRNYLYYFVQAQIQIQIVRLWSKITKCCCGYVIALVKQRFTDMTLSHKIHTKSKHQVPNSNLILNPNHRISNPKISDLLHLYYNLFDDRMYIR